MRPHLRSNAPTSVYAHALPTGSYIMLYTAGSKPTQFHANPEVVGYPQVSPDGKWVLYDLWNRGGRIVFERDGQDSFEEVFRKPPVSTQ